MRNEDINAENFQWSTALANSYQQRMEGSPGFLDISIQVPAPFCLAEGWEGTRQNLARQWMATSAAPASTRQAIPASFWQTLPGEGVLIKRQFLIR
jgi:hypothetical protein